MVSYIIEGSFTFILEGKPVTAHKGDTVILDCYKPHEYYTNDSFESIWVHFGGANSRDFYNEITKNSGNLIKSTDPEHIKRLLFRIYNNIAENTTASELNHSLDLYKIITELAAPQTINSKSKVSYDDQIHEIKKYIAEHLQENISIKDLACIMHMSTSHFSRIFKQQTGFAPYDYVLIYRLNKAKEYLQKTNLTVSEITYEVGFNSESNFIYFFTKHNGISPNKFRKLNF